MKKQVTEKDIEVLHALVKKPDGKLSEIASSFGIPQSSAYRIYKKLSEIGVIKGRVYILDFSYLGYQYVVEFNITTNKDQVPAVISFIDDCEQVAFYGIHDNDETITFVAYFSDEREINSFKEMLTNQFDLKSIKQHYLKLDSVKFKQIKPCTKTMDKTFSILPR